VEEETASCHGNHAVTVGENEQKSLHLFVRETKAAWTNRYEGGIIVMGSIGWAPIRTGATRRDRRFSFGSLAFWSKPVRAAPDFEVDRRSA